MTTHGNAQTPEQPSNYLNSIIKWFAGIVAAIIGGYVVYWIQTKPPEYSVIGHWVNENPQTSGITRIEVDTRLNTVYIDVWGKCHPSDCYWGKKSVSRKDAKDNVFNITWNQGFAVTDQKFQILRDKRLQVSGSTKFTDGSGRPDYESVNYFVKK